MDIGDGENWVGEDGDGHNLVDIPDNLRSESVASMIDRAWPGLRNGQTDGVLDGAILCGRNAATHTVNDDVLKLLPGEDIVCASAEALLGEDAGVAIPNEYLNSQTPNGMPAHELRLKEGVPGLGGGSFAPFSDFSPIFLLSQKSLKFRHFSRILP